MNFQKVRILAILCCVLASFGLSAEPSKGFTDTVILKDGTMLESVKATSTSDGLVVTNEDGETTVYKKKDVKSFQKGGTNSAKVSSEVSDSNNLGKAFKSKIGIEFVPIPAGEFTMGCSVGDNDCRDSEKPAHKVKITQGFYMGKYEVTQAQWKSVMGENPSGFNSCGGNCPVEQVSWDDIQDFLRNLNEKEGRTGDKMIRLPTEAEWEYAARAGTGAKTYATDLDSIAWYGKNSGNKTHPVGKKKPNAFGLYDMIGNVLEWVEDWYDADYYATSETEDPQGSPNGKLRVLRGGSWFDLADFNDDFDRVSDRHYGDPAGRFVYFGFRLVAPQ